MITWRELEAEIEDWRRRQNWYWVPNLAAYEAPEGWEMDLAQHLEIWINDRRTADQPKPSAS